MTNLTTLNPATGLYEVLQDQNGDVLLGLAVLNLTAAQIQALFTTPLTVIPALGAGKVAIVEHITFKMVTTSTVYTGGGAVSLQYSGGSAVANTIAASVVTAGAGTSYTIREGVDVTALANTAITISNATAAFAAGTGTASVTVLFRVATL